MPAPTDLAISDDVQAVKDFVGAMQKAIEDAKRNLVRAKYTQKLYSDSRRCDIEFEVGQEVLLRSRNLRLKAPRAQRLLPRYIASFVVVVQVGDVAYRLALRAYFRIHDVFLCLRGTWLVRTTCYHHSP